MPTQTLFAYVLGTDLDKVADDFQQRFDALQAEHAWVLKDVWVVNQRLPEPPAPAREWDLGFNLTLPATKRPANWESDVLAIANVFSQLNQATKRSFVIGIADPSSDPRDLYSVESANVDIEKLRAALTEATSKAPKRK